MKFQVSRTTLNKDIEFIISEEKYELLKKSQQVLRSALSIEEIYEIVISNYFEFEKDTLEITLNNMLYRDISYHNIFESRSTLDRRIINILTAVRLYLDTIIHNALECKNKENFTKNDIKRIISQEYENNKYYKFMEAFRNYVQHYGLAIHLTRRNSSWTSLDEKGQMEYSFNIFSNQDRLRDDKHFKVTSLTEMEEKIDLKLAIRHYIECISNIHDNIRTLIKESVEYSRESLEEINTQFKELNKKGDYDSLRAKKFDKNEQYESFPLFLKWDDVRIKLQKKNKRLVNLKKCYVTGQNLTS